MKRRKKYYAVHFINNNENLIFTDWEDAQEKMRGRNNIFHGFDSKKECQHWFDSITKEKEIDHTKNVKKLKDKNIENVVILEFKKEDLLQLKKKAKHYKVSIETYIQGLIQEDIWE